MDYTNGKSDLMNYFNIPRFDVPELVRSADEAKIMRDVWFNVRTLKSRKTDFFINQLKVCMRH